MQETQKQRELGRRRGTLASSKSCIISAVISSLVLRRFIVFSSCIDGDCFCAASGLLLSWILDFERTSMMLPDFCTRLNQPARKGRHGDFERGVSTNYKLGNPHRETYTASPRSVRAPSTRKCAILTREGKRAERHTLHSLKSCIISVCISAVVLVAISSWRTDLPDLYASCASSICFACDLYTGSPFFGAASGAAFSFAALDVSRVSAVPGRDALPGW